MKEYHIDGLPGITLAGKKGDTGSRGSMSFCYNKLERYPKDFSAFSDHELSIGVVKNGESYEIVLFPTYKVLPILNDYVLEVSAEVSTLYVVSDYVKLTSELFPGEHSEDDFIMFGKEKVSLTSFIKDVEDDIRKIPGLFFTRVDQTDLDGDDSISIGVNTGSDSGISIISESEGDPIDEDSDEIIYEEEENGDEYLDAEDINIYMLFKLDEWQYSNGVPNDLDIGVYMKSINLSRKKWAGAYKPKYIKKREFYMSNLGRPFSYIDESGTQWNESSPESFRKYCTNILGFVENEEDFMLCAKPVEDGEDLIPEMVECQFPTLSGDNSINTLLNDIRLDAYFRIRILNIMTNTPYANIPVKVTLYCGKEYFYSEAGFMPLRNTDDRRPLNWNKDESVSIMYHRYTTDGQGSYSPSIRTNKNIDTITLTGATDSLGYFRSRLYPFATGIDDNLVIAYIKVEYNDNDNIKKIAGFYTNDAFFPSISIVCSDTFSGDLSDIDALDYVKCYVLPRNFYKNADAKYQLETNRDFERNLIKYEYAGAGTFPGIAKIENAANYSKIAGFSILLDDKFVYYDSADPTLQIELVAEEGQKLSDASLNDYIEGSSEYEQDAEPTAFMQFITSTSLSDETLANIRIVAELYDNDSFFTNSVSTCTSKLWNTELYDENDASLFIDASGVIDPDVIPNGETLGDSIAYSQAMYLEQARNALNYPKDTWNGVNPIHVYENDMFLGNTHIMYNPVGLSKNYDYTLNFDNERILPCSFMIKDFSDEGAGGVFATSVVVPEESVKNAKINVYMYYKKTASTFNKVLLGTTTYNETL